MHPYQRYFHKYQAAYIRLKLRIVYLYWQGPEFDKLAGEFGINHKKVRCYVNTYLKGGLSYSANPRFVPGAVN